MKVKALLSGILLFSLLTAVSAQTSADSIKIRKTTLGMVYTRDNQDLSIRQLLQVTKPNPEAYKEMKSAKNHFIAAGCFSVTGAILIIWPVMALSPDEDIKWVPMAIGAGLFVVSLPELISFRKHTEKAVDIYNSGFPKPVPREVTLNLLLTGRGIGLSIRF